MVLHVHLRGLGKEHAFLCTFKFKVAWDVDVLLFLGVGLYLEM